MYLGSRVRGMSRFRNGATGVDLRALLWPTGTEAGMWLDQSDASTAFQDSAGTTAGAAESPVGLRLDKRLGLAVGAEELTNGSFDSDTVWTKGTGWSISGGQAIHTGATADFIRQGAVAVGATYLCVVDVAQADGSNFVQLYLGNSPAVLALTAPGVFTFRAPAAQSDALGFALRGTGACAVNSFSVKRIPGNHVLQATTTARPVWKQASGIYSDQFDGGEDNLATTFSAGVLTAGMDAFVAMRRNSAAVALALGMTKTDAAHWLLDFNSGASAAGTAVAGAGSAWSALVNGSVVGSAGATSALQMHNALSSGAWGVAEVHNVDLSSWTGLCVAAADSTFSPIDVGGLILCPAQSDATRAIVRRELGRKVGLSL